MQSKIYVNLPVKDLPKSRAFFSSLGDSFNEEWSHDKGACLILGKSLFAMLLTEPFFAGFTTKPVAHTKQTTEVINCLSSP